MVHKMKQSTSCTSSGFERKLILETGMDEYTIFIFKSATHAESAHQSLHGWAHWCNEY